MNEISIREILNILPHRYPFLLIDRVTSCVPFKSITALKNVTVTEPFFQGHFPGKPIMPGVLILEAMAQATGLLAFHSGKAQSQNGNMYYLVGIDKARFKRPVVPGDQLIISANLQRQIKNIYKFDAVAQVAQQVVAVAEFMTTQMDREA
jgi:3-hydroxyacyl-[acyl-carrier-protein] dehydratase